MKVLQGGQPGEARGANARRIASNTALIIVLRCGIAAVHVAIVALLARALGPAGYGVWSTAIAYVGIFSILIDLGLAQAATQRMSAEPEREPEWLGAFVMTRTAVSVFLLAVCLAGVPLLARSGDLRLVTLVLSVTILTGVPNSLMAVFESRLRPGPGLALTALEAVILLGAVGTLTFAGTGILGYALAFVAAALVVGVARLLFLRHFARVALRRGVKLWRPLMRLALPLGIAGVLVAIYYRIDVVLIFNLRGAEEAGIYGAAYRFLDPLHLLPQAVLASLFPVLSAAHGRDPARLGRLVQNGIDYSAIISLPMLGGSIVAAGPLVDFLLGDGFERAAGLVPILMVAFVSICYGYLAGYLAAIVGLQWRYAAYAAVGAVANVALNLILIPPYGAYGAAWVTAVTEVTTMSLLLATVLRALQFRPSLARPLRAALAAAAMVVPMALAAPAGLLVTLLVGVGVYVLVLIAVRGVVPSELLALARKS